jgi:hypothetical protein
MSGGITQLLAKGVQDKFLSGNPSVSFFRSTYSQYNYFSQSVERQTIQTNVTPGGMSTIRIERKGDLVNNMYLTATDLGTSSDTLAAQSAEITSFASVPSLSDFVTAQTATITGAVSQSPTTTRLSVNLTAMHAGNYVTVAWTNTALGTVSYLVAAFVSTTSVDITVPYDARMGTFGTCTIAPYASNIYGAPSTNVAYNFIAAHTGALHFGHYVTVNDGTNKQSFQVVSPTSTSYGILLDVPSTSTVVLSAPTALTLTNFAQNILPDAVDTFAINLNAPFQVYTGQVLEVRDTAYDMSYFQVVATSDPLSNAIVVMRQIPNLYPITETTTLLRVNLRPVLNGNQTIINFRAPVATAPHVGKQVTVKNSASSLNGSWTVVYSTTASVTLAIDTSTVAPSTFPDTTSINQSPNKIQMLDWSKVIDKVELWIGGVMVDMQDQTFHDLIEPITMADTFARRYTGSGTGQNTLWNTFYPFKFFFCKNAENALPLIGMQFQDVELRVYWSNSIDTTMLYEAWANFIYLEDNERKFFVNNSAPIDMLVWQVQRQLIPSDYRAQIVFTQPVKFICAPVSPYVDGNQQILMQINGTNIGEYRGIPHYQDVPQYYNIPFGLYNPDGYGAGAPAPLLIVPYCLDTSTLQPTGTLNFSRIDNFNIMAKMGSGVQLTGSPISIFPAGQYIYAVNYNILRLQNGMAGIVYGN